MRYLSSIPLALAILLIAAWSAASVLLPKYSPPTGAAPGQWSRLNAALVLNPANAAYWNDRAQWARGGASGLAPQEEVRAAEQSLHEASRLAPSWEVPLLKLANQCAVRSSLAASPGLEPCRRLYFAALRRNPTYGYAHYRYADLLYDCAKREPGDKKEKSIGICRQYGLSLHLMRRTLDYSSWYLKAEQTAYARCLDLAPGYAQARVLRPKTPRQWAAMAQELVKSKGPEAYYAAKDALLQDLKDAPGRGDDYQAFSRGLELAGLPRAGVEALRQYLAVHPADSNTWNFLLQTMIDHHKVFTGPEIAEAVGQARSQASFSPSQMLTLASAACRAGQVETALQLFKEALTGDSTDARAFASLGGCLLRTGKPREAIQSYGRAVALKPDSPDYRIALARAYAKDRQYEAAVEELQRVLAAQPEHKEAKRTLREIGIY